MGKEPHKSILGVPPPPPKKWNWGREVTPGIPFIVPFFLSWGRLDNWNRGTPYPLPTKVGGMGYPHSDKYQFARTFDL